MFLLGARLGRVVGLAPCPPKEARMKISWKVTLALFLIVIPTIAWAATETPVRVTKGPEEFAPAASGGFLAWAQVPNHESYRSIVMAQVGDGAAFKVNPKSTFARTGGLDGSHLVYAQYRGIDDEGRLLGGDLSMIDLSTREPIAVPDGVNTKQEEYAPTISGEWLLFGRATTGKRFRNQLLLRNLSTGETRVLTTTRNIFLDTGQVNGLFAVWHSCGRHAPCDVFRYDIASGETLEVPNPNDRNQYAPGVASDGTVYFFRSGYGCGANPVLQSWSPIEGTVTLVDFPAGVDAYGGYVFEDPDTGRRVLYSRVKCVKDRFAPAPSDLYQIID
jgi:hypothetical protein